MNLVISIISPLLVFSRCFLSVGFVFVDLLRLAWFPVDFFDLLGFVWVRVCGRFWGWDFFWELVLVFGFDLVGGGRDEGLVIGVEGVLFGSAWLWVSRKLVYGSGDDDLGSKSRGPCLLSRLSVDLVTVVDKSGESVSTDGVANNLFNLDYRD
ncbi:hypothetical protein ACOSP7_018734 [Xanthoceras sorbifolium]